MKQKNLSYYQALPYTRRCRLDVEDGDRYWLAWIERLAGCKVDGASKAEAFRKLDEIFDDYIAAKLERGSPIPEPKRWAEGKRRRPKPTVETISVIVRPQTKSGVGFPEAQQAREPESALV